MTERYATMTERHPLGELIADMRSRRPGRRAGTLACFALAAILGLGLLSACSGEGSQVSCGSVHECTITLDRGVDADASVLGAKVKLVAVNGNQVTVEVAGQQETLTTGETSANIGGLHFTLDKLTDSNVIIKVTTG